MIYKLLHVLQFFHYLLSLLPVLCFLYRLAMVLATAEQTRHRLTCTSQVGTSTKVQASAWAFLMGENPKKRGVAGGLGALRIWV